MKLIHIQDQKKDGERRGNYKVFAKFQARIGVQSTTECNGTERWDGFKRTFKVYKVKNQEERGS